MFLAANLQSRWSRMLWMFDLENSSTNGHNELPTWIRETFDKLAILEHMSDVQGRFRPDKEARETMLPKCLEEPKTGTSLPISTPGYKADETHLRPGSQGPAIPVPCGITFS